MGLIERRTLGEQVYMALKTAIIEDQLPPGTELHEVALAEQHGVSRGPIREALGRLSSEGLVQLRPRRGAVVPELSKKEFLDAYQVREALEVLAMRLAVPQITEAHLAELDRLMERMAEAADEHDVDAFFEHNGAFHRFFVDISDNPRLQEVHAQISSSMRRYRRRSLDLRGDLRPSIAEHKAIMAAVRDGDSERAAALLAQHISLPQRRLMGLSDEEWARMQTAAERRADVITTGERELEAL